MDKSRKFRRGDSSPEHPGKVFIRYRNGVEYWSDVLALKRRRAFEKEANKRYQRKPSSKRKFRGYMRSYYHRPYQRKKQLAYYRRPEVRARYKAKRNSDPEVIRKREAHEAFLKERAEYRKTDAYREKRNAQARVLYHANKHKVNQRAGDRRRKNPMIRLKQNLSRSIRYAIKKCHGKKADRTVDLIGCSIREFRDAMEKLFLPGMSWENYGTAWELDHRAPLSAFNLADPYQQKLAFNVLNTRPLWKTDNRRKSDKIEGQSVRGRDLAKTRVIIPFRTVA